MIVTARWLNRRKEYRETSKNYSEWVEVVDVSAPDLDVTITMNLPNKVPDVTAYLQSSGELKGKLDQAKKKQDGEQFQVTLSEVGK